MGKRRLTESLEEVIFQEVSLGMRRVNAPPVVNEDVEDAQDDHQERGRPFGLEPDGYHDASRKAHNGDKYTCNTPLALENEPDE